MGSLHGTESKHTSYACECGVETEVADSEQGCILRML